MKAEDKIEIRKRTINFGIVDIWNVRYLTGKSKEFIKEFERSPYVHAIKPVLKFLEDHFATQSFNNSKSLESM